MTLLLVLACTSKPDSPRTDDTATTPTDDTSALPDDTSSDTTVPDDTAPPTDDTAASTDDTAPECVKSPPVDSAPADTGPDADGDGVTTEDGDCDDQDARIYPGAEDPCDGVDQDCDGDAQGTGSCGDVAFLEASYDGMWTGGDRSSKIFLDEADTDFDGDGVPDLLLHWSPRRSVAGARAVAVLAEVSEGVAAGGAAFPPSGDVGHA